MHSKRAPLPLTRPKPQQTNTPQIHRKFYWSEYNLWPQHLPARTLVVLAGSDVLCPANEVKAWLEEETSARVSGGRGGVYVLCVV